MFPPTTYNVTKADPCIDDAEEMENDTNASAATQTTTHACRRLLKSSPVIADFATGVIMRGEFPNTRPRDARLTSQERTPCLLPQQTANSG